MRTSTCRTATSTVATAAIVFTLLAPGVVPAMAASDGQLGDPHVTALISARPNGRPARTWGSAYASVNEDGRFVAFHSDAHQLVWGVRTDEVQVYRRDRVTGQTILVSRDSFGNPGNAGSDWASISADGTRIAFTSYASNLTDFPTGGLGHLYVYDTTTQTTTLLSEGQHGQIANGSVHDPDISADGSHVAFTSSASNMVQGDTNLADDAFVVDIASGEITMVSRSRSGGIADAASSDPKISADGRLVVFDSPADNLVPGDDNDRRDVFVFDSRTHDVSLVSVGYDGAPANAESFTADISADGSSVVFKTFATNIVEGRDVAGTLVLVKRATGDAGIVSWYPDGQPAPGWAPTVSDDGTRVTYDTAEVLDPEDTNGAPDVFLFDAATDQTTIVSWGRKDVPANGFNMYSAISGDGRWVAFHGYSTNLVRHDFPGAESNDVFATRMP